MYWLTAAIITQPRLFILRCTSQDTMQYKITVTHPWGSIHQCPDFCMFRIWALRTQTQVQFSAKGRLIQLNLLHSHCMLLPAFYTRHLFVSLCLFKIIIWFKSLFICHFSSLQLLSLQAEFLSQNSLPNLPVKIGHSHARHHPFRDFLYAN